jgi:hypothetical protein
MPIVNLAAHTLAIQFVLVACLDEQLWAVTRAAEMTLQILPATVGFEGAVCLGTAVGTECLTGLASHNLTKFAICNTKKKECI